MICTAVAPYEEAPVDFDKGRHRVKVGKFWCWLLSSLLFCVVLPFFVVYFVRLSNRCQILVCSPVCAQVE